ncbi:MAG TPA: chloride channel protein [Trueperaceae bacterium]
MAHRRLRRRRRLLTERLIRRFNIRESRETTSLIASAILIGLLAGLAAVGFDRVVHFSEVWIRNLVTAEGTVLGTVTALLIPAIGALLVTPIVLYWAPDVRGSGVPNVMFAVSNLGGRLAKRIVFWRPVASAIAIGTGAPLGTEGPVVQLTAAIASATGGFMRLNDSRRRNLLAVAAAGGISATFNAPIAGMLFALEVILGQFGSRYVASVVIGSVTASVVSRRFLGPDPAFSVRNYTLGSPWELPLYLALSVLAGFVGVGLVKAMAASDDLFDRLRVRPWLRPLSGGLAVGLLGLLVPQILGRGYEVTGSILRGEATGIGLLLAIVIAKTLATSVALAAWLPGGVFAPLLMIGASFGGAFGTVAAGQFPGLELEPGAFALVGMSAVFSAAERAPMSTILLVFEMSGDYQLILPLLLATVVSMLVSELIQSESIYHVMLSRRGLSLQRHRAFDLLQTVQVREVMVDEAPAMPASASLAEAEELMATGGGEAFVLLEPGGGRKVMGVVSRGDLEKARQAGLEDTTPLVKIGTRAVQVAQADDPISEALERMAEHGHNRLPVVDSRDRMTLLGMVRQGDVARAYYRAVQRERSVEHAGERRRLRDLTGQEIVELRIPSDSPLAGKTLREAGLPPWCVIVAIRRRGSTHFPHGNTRLLSGDSVVANVAPGRAAEFRKRFESRAG